MLRALSVPAGNERGPLFMEQALAAIHQADAGRSPLRLLALRHCGEVTLALDFPDEMQATVAGQLYAQYPDAKLISLPEEALCPLG